MMKQRSPNGVEIDYHKPLLLISAVLGVVVCIETYVILSSRETADAANVVTFTLDLLPEFAAALLAFIGITVFLRRKGLSDASALAQVVAKRVSESIVQPAPVTVQQSSPVQLDWERKFGAADEVLIVARFCDHLVIAAREHIISFLRRNGCLTIVLLDPRESAAVRFANDQRNAGAGEKVPEDVGDRILSTIRVVQNIAKEVEIFPDVGQERVRIRLSKKAPLFSAYYFVGASLVISPYEHFHTRHGRSPRFDIDLTRVLGVAEFMENEFAHWAVEAAPCPTYQELREQVERPS